MFQDIDQRFSTFAELLRQIEVLSPPELQQKLPNAEFLSCLYDYQAWIEPHLSEIKYHTATGMFRLRKKISGGPVHCYYRNRSTMSWKVIPRGIFNRLPSGRTSYPIGTPQILMPDFKKDQFNAASLRKALDTWKKYFPADSLAVDYWGTWISRFELLSKGGAFLEEYAKGVEEDNVTLASFRKYNKNHLPNTTLHQKDQAELDAIAVEERANPTVSRSYCNIELSKWVETILSQNLQYLHP